MEIAMKRKKKMLHVVLLSCIAIAVIVSILAYNANKILKYKLEQFLGEAFSVEQVTLGFGNVQAEKIRLVRPDGKQVLSVGALSLTPDFISLFKKEKSISGLRLKDPYLFLEADKKGEIQFPLPRVNGKRADVNQAGAGVLIKKVGIERGALDYFDRKVEGPPALIRLREIQLTFKNLSLPVQDRFSDYDLSASLPGKTGKGYLKSGGKINLKTRDAKVTLNIKTLDITLLKPYYQKKGDVDVTKGTLSLDADIHIAHSQIHSAGRIVIRDLAFVSGKGTFLGLPLIAVTKLMKDRNNEIALDFTLDGDLKNPKFNIRDSLIQKITLSLAKTLGLSFEAIGKSVFDFGGEALKKIFQ